MEKGPRQNDRINTIIQNAKTSNGDAVLEAIEKQLRHKSVSRKNHILQKWNKAVKSSQVIMRDPGNDFLDEVGNIIDGLGHQGGGRRRKTKKHTRTRKNRSRHRK